MLTQQEKVTVWETKNRLTQELSFVPEADKSRRNQLAEQIDYCSRQLVEDKLEPGDAKPTS